MKSSSMQHSALPNCKNYQGWNNNTIKEMDLQIEKAEEKKINAEGKSTHTKCWHHGRTKHQ